MDYVQGVYEYFSRLELLYRVCVSVCVCVAVCLSLSIRPSIMPSTGLSAARSDEAQGEGGEINLAALLKMHIHFHTLG